MTFGERLKELRSRHNMSQQALADRLGIDRSTIGKYETNVYEQPKLSTLVQLSEMFAVSIDYLVAGKEFTFQSNEELERLQLRVRSLEDTISKIEKLALSVKIRH